jgi:hypothetical protein
MLNGQKKVVTTILLYGAGILLICNYVLANGGYPTLLGIDAHFSIAAIPFVSAWLAYKGLVALGCRKWGKAFMYITFVIIVVVLPKIVIPILTENSKSRAYQQVKEFILSQQTDKFTVTFWGGRDPQLETDFKTFLSNPDMSAVRLDFHVPLHGRYDYIITPNSSRPFELTFWEHGVGRGGKIMISLPTRRKHSRK